MDSYVIKIGGSLISPDTIDTSFLKSFRSTIEKHVATGNEKFAIVVGGGKICRRYQDALEEVTGNNDSNGKDWIGIYTIRLHAEFFMHMFGELAHNEVITDFSTYNPQDVSAPITIVGAEAPGHSSNYDTVEVARATGSTSLINLSNIDFVYTDDPQKNPDAVKIEQVSWKEYLGYIPSDWSPGLSTPFDPISARYADEHNIDVVFMKGDPIENLDQYIVDGIANGSVISNRFA